MKESERIALMKNRFNTKHNTPKNLKCPGVMRALSREIRNAEAKLAE